MVRRDGGGCLRPWEPYSLKSGHISDPRHVSSQPGHRLGGIFDYIFLRLGKAKLAILKLAAIAFAARGFAAGCGGSGCFWKLFIFLSTCVFLSLRAGRSVRWSSQGPWGLTTMPLEEEEATDAVEELQGTSCGVRDDFL